LGALRSADAQHHRHGGERQAVAASDARGGSGGIGQVCRDPEGGREYPAAQVTDGI